jgi:hypothetical protein
VQYAGSPGDLSTARVDFGIPDLSSAMETEDDLEHVGSALRFAGTPTAHRIS